jgi:Asp-tRNA(Asn)/Glu-tRNA(Gln) amidotransferase A subunit family amidase
MATEEHLNSDRRQLLAALGCLGVGTVAFQRSLVAQSGPKGEVTAEMVAQAEWISGIKLTEAQRQALATRMGRTIRQFEDLRKIPLGNAVPPSLTFLPSNQVTASSPRGLVAPISADPPKKPEKGEDLAFLPVHQLAGLIRTKQVSSVELTKLYLERLHRYDAALKCVVTFTDDLALKQAAEADREIAAGKYRGPLHGIPWGAKDLIAYPGYKTTWGAKPFKDQVIDRKATVARKLEEAGAVMIAKLTLGALALGDQWFGGMTRNPWNVKQGSSGSSAGSASTAAAGLVGFAIGSETYGSIVSPCTRCGATGLRPTFGRISRDGCMTLSWTMDKLGPITRSVEDCALVLGAIHGADAGDTASVDRPFIWPGQKELKSLRVGYFEKPGNPKEVEVLKKLGVQLIPIALPNKYPVNRLQTILNAESAAAFDDITRQSITDGLDDWMPSFRHGQFIPAVEYIRANRVRTLLMREMESLFEKVDLYLGGDDLLLTNLTGHPTVVMPNGFLKSKNGIETPTAITFTGRLFGESDLLTVARAFQEATGFHLRRPPMDKATPENAGL